MCGPRVPPVDDGGAGDEVVQGAAIAADEDQPEAEEEHQEAQGRDQHPDDRLAARQIAAVSVDGPKADDRHAERATAGSERVGAVEERPPGEGDRRQPRSVAQPYVRAEDRRHEVVEHLAGHGEQPEHHERIDREAGAARDDARVRSLQLDVSPRVAGGHAGALSSFDTSSGGPSARPAGRLNTCRPNGARRSRGRHRRSEHRRSPHSPHQSSRSR